MRMCLSLVVEAAVAVAIIHPVTALAVVVAVVF
jgi:hypothetical protein